MPASFLYRNLAISLLSLCFLVFEPLPTFAAPPQATFYVYGWAARDLGKAYIITEIRYSPRSDNTDTTSKLFGGEFQGSNDAKFTNPVTLQGSRHQGRRWHLCFDSTSDFQYHSVSVCPLYWTFWEITYR